MYKIDRRHKTVFVLGAGFSIEAGGPPQADLLKRILKIPPDSAPIRRARKELLKFITDGLGVKPSALENISLEDVFTPIDRCLADEISLRNFSGPQLLTVRRQLQYLITVAIEQSFDAPRHANRRYVRNFARKLVEVASERAKRALRTSSAKAAKAYDPISIISLNWDVVLDKALHEELRVFDGNAEGDYEPIGVVDYCCYISSVREHDPRIRPGLWALGSRGYNVKLLKLHGSMNWLQCTNCQRLFVQFHGKDIASMFLRPLFCRHCRQYAFEPTLQSSLVMPTFLKDLTNFQVKLIWQNASVELMEAKRIVFIGYSLPQADFEFRQLLSRMIHRDAEIHVVLKTDDEGVKYRDECKRFSDFFGGRRVTFDGEGARSFVESIAT